MANFMRYPLVIHYDGTSYGVVAPDIPGCGAQGYTLDEAIDNAHEAIVSHLTILAEDGETAPIAGNLDDYHGEYQDAYTWAVADINVSLPTILDAQIQDQVSAGNAKDRSSFLTEAAIEKLAALK